MPDPPSDLHLHLHPHHHHHLTSRSISQLLTSKKQRQASRCPLLQSLFGDNHRPYLPWSDHPIRHEIYRPNHVRSSAPLLAIALPLLALVGPRASRPLLVLCHRRTWSRHAGRRAPHQTCLWGLRCEAHTYHIPKYERFQFLPPLANLPFFFFFSSSSSRAAILTLLFSLKQSLWALGRS